MRRIVLVVLVLAGAAIGAVAATGASSPPAGYDVRAIFDDAPVNQGADVLVAGVAVGTVSHLGVTPDHKAALTLRITDHHFAPFRTDARCGTRQQSLIGERAVVCATGSASARPLPEIRHGAGAGAHLLPVTRTYSAVDLDLVNAIYRRPAPEQLTILLSELGAGVATRGPALASIIRRANPGLGEADRLIRQLAAQRRQLQRLAVEGEQVTRPLARRRRELAGFIRSSERTAAVTVRNRAAYGAGFDRLPASLRDLGPLMDQLDRFARGTAPVLRNVAAGAPDLGRATAAVAPFARESDPTLRRLATSTQIQARELTRAVPLARRLQVLGRRLPRPATDASRLLRSFRAGNGIPNLLRSIYGSASSGNGFDGASHYLRAEVLSGSCGEYAPRPFFGCDAQFGVAKAAAAARPRGAATSNAASVPMLDYLLGGVAVRPRANRSALSGQPILIGGVTILAAVVLTFAAYNATSGLPFVPTYRVFVNAPNAGQLFKDADVRMAGSRIGQVAATRAVPHRSGHATARLELELSKDAAPLPVDTRFIIRPRSYAGADYVDVLRGHARATIPDGGSVPLGHFEHNVSLQDALTTYTAPVRKGIRRQLRGFAYGFAGRGRDLNSALGRLDTLLGHLRPAAHLLRSPGTHLERFIAGLERVAAEVAPVGAVQADGFAELHRTFAALSHSPRALRDVILASPPAEEAVSRDAPSIKAYLRASDRLSHALAPAARELPGASRALAGALEAGARGLPATRRTLPRLDSLARSLGAFATAPAVIPAVDRLSLLGSTLRPLTSVLAPAETRCRYASLLFRNLASALSEGPVTGAALRVVILAVSAAPNSEAVLASAPSANAEHPGLGALHSNPYPDTAGPGQPRSCAAGQEGYRPGGVAIGNPRPPADAVTESPRAR